MNFMPSFICILMFGPLDFLEVGKIIKTHDRQ